MAEKRDWRRMIARVRRWQGKQAVQRPVIEMLGEQWYDTVEVVERYVYEWTSMEKPQIMTEYSFSEEKEG